MSARETLPPRGERAADLRLRVERMLRQLRESYPDARCALHYESPFQLLIATVLSAQCTDERVNMVTPQLFNTYPDPSALASANPDEVEEIVRSTGFFRQKTRSLIGSSRMIVEEFDGEVPGTIEDLVKLPGVARKTANVVISNCFADSPQGIAVDTHVQRISRRLGLVKSWEPNAIEKDLMSVFPKSEWNSLTHLLIEHGRKTCRAINPKCDSCCLSDACPSFGRFPYR